MTTRTPVWTADALDGLGVTTDLVTAGKIFRIGRTKAYELAASGDFPVPTIKVGAKYVVSVPVIKQRLGMSVPQQRPAEDNVLSDRREEGV